MSDFALFGVNTANPQTATSASSDNSELASDFDTFLTLLTTQLENQLPTDPLDSNQFTEQLVQYSTVEQQIKSNEHLESILGALSTANVASLASYIGTEVAASGETTQLVNGEATWAFDAASPAAEATIRIRDASGNVVYNEVRSLESGKGSFVWDGRSDTGVQMPDGFYTISINAQNQGRPVNVSTNAVEGLVTAIDTTGTEPTLTVDGQRVPLSAVSSIKGAS